MNIQAMMKQAQKMQQDMMNAKNEIDNTIFTGKASFVTVELKGNHELLKVNIAKETIDKDEIEIIEDLLVVAINEANRKIEKDTEEKLGKHTKGIPGLF